jgi:hypothetical protein
MENCEVFVTGRRIRFTSTSLLKRRSLYTRIYRERVCMAPARLVVTGRHIRYTDFVDVVGWLC